MANGQWPIAKSPKGIYLTTQSTNPNLFILLIAAATMDRGERWKFSCLYISTLSTPRLGCSTSNAIVGGVAEKL